MVTNAGWQAVLDACRAGVGKMICHMVHVLVRGTSIRIGVRRRRAPPFQIYKYAMHCCYVPMSRGVATAVYMGYTYPPKISPSKLFMG